MATSFFINRGTFGFERLSSCNCIIGPPKLARHRSPIENAMETDRMLYAIQLVTLWSQLAGKNPLFLHRPPDMVPPLSA